MAAYNAEKYLRPAIESVLRQSYRNFELLIVDDASTDGTSELIASYTDDRIRVISNPLNRGVSPSRQLSLEQARGEYIAVLDADDVALPTRLEKQVAFLDAHPDVVLIGSAFEVIDVNGNHEATKPVVTDPAAIRWKLLFDNCIVHSTVMFRREAALAVGGYETTLAVSEDRDLYARLLKLGVLTQLSDVLVQHRRHTTGLWQGATMDTRTKYATRVVTRSVFAQTGILVPERVAACLSRFGSPNHTDDPVLDEAYAMIEECLNQQLTTSSLSTAQRKRVVALAVDHILRLAWRHPSSKREAWRTATRCLYHHRCYNQLLSGKMLKLALRAFWSTWPAPPRRPNPPSP